MDLVSLDNLKHYKSWMKHQIQMMRIMGWNISNQILILIKPNTADRLLTFTNASPSQARSPCLEEWLVAGLLRSIPPHSSPVQGICSELWSVAVSMVKRMLVTVPYDSLSYGSG